MASRDDRERKAERLERRRRRVETQQQTAIAITAGGAVLIFIILLVVVLSSGSSRRREQAQTAFDKAEAERLKQLIPEEVPTVIRRPLTEEEKADLESRDRRHQGRLSGKALKEQMEKEFQAAKRRAALYAKDGRWGKAIRAYERLADRFDDEELRLRCQPELDELLARAGDAFRDVKRTAEQRAQARKYLEGRTALLEFADTCEIEAYAEEARELAEKLARDRVEYLEKHYAESLAPIEAMLPEWRFDEAVAEAAKLRFDEPDYQQRLERRLAELRALVALKKRMIATINMAMPRVKKRALRAPGLDGEFTDADAEGLRAETAQGEERFTWVKVGPEAGWRLARMAGDAEDPQQALAVARLLIEVGYLKRAKQQLEAAKELGANTAADLARLGQKEAAGGGAPE